MRFLFLCACVCVCAHVYTSVMYAPAKPRRRCEVVHLNSFQSRAIDLFELTPSLHRNARFIHLFALHVLPPIPSASGGVIAANWGASFPAQPTCCLLRGAGMCHGDCIPVLALTLPLLTAITRIVPFWDAPYLFLITCVTQIELFSSSSKEVPYTLD